VDAKPKTKNVQLTDDHEADFWAQTKKADQNRCWEWNGTKNERDLPIFYVSGRPVNATRISWCLDHLLPLPTYHHVSRRKDVCNNDACVNPNHLRRIRRRPRISLKNNINSAVRVLIPPRSRAPGKHPLMDDTPGKWSRARLTIEIASIKKIVGVQVGATTQLAKKLNVLNDLARSDQISSLLDSKLGPLFSKQTADAANQASVMAVMKLLVQQLTSTNKRLDELSTQVQNIADLQEELQARTVPQEPAEEALEEVVDEIAIPVPEVTRPALALVPEGANCPKCGAHDYGLNGDPCASCAEMASSSEKEFSVLSKSLMQAFQAKMSWDQEPTAQDYESLEIVFEISKADCGGDLKEAIPLFTQWLSVFHNRARLDRSIVPSPVEFANANWTRS